MWGFPERFRGVYRLALVFVLVLSTVAGGAAVATADSAGSAGVTAAGSAGVTAAGPCEGAIFTNAESDDGEPVLELPKGEATIRGASNPESDADLSVTLDASDARTGPFVRTIDATVDERGQWSATADLSDVETGTEIEISLDGADADPVTGVVVADPAPLNSSERDDIDGCPSIDVTAPGSVISGGQTTITVTGTDVEEIRVSGEVGGWVVNSTDPADQTTVPDPNDTPYESRSGDTWTHVFGTESDTNELELTVTAPDSTGTYEFTAEVGNASGVTSTQSFSVEVTRATVSFDDQTVDETDQEISISAVALSDGGFVAVHEGSAAGPVVGTSGFLEAGRQSDLNIALDEDVSSGTTLVAMPHRDTDDDRVYEFDASDSETPDMPYTEFGAPVADSATMTIDRPPADFDVSDLSPVAVSPQRGDIISTVQARVENTGGQEGTQWVEYRIGDAVVASQEVTLAPGESTTVAFAEIDTSSLEAGEYRHGIYATDANATGVISVGAPGPVPDVPGVSRTVVNATAGGDNIVDRDDVLGVVRAYVGNERVGGVSITRSDVLAIVQYYVTQ